MILGIGTDIVEISRINSMLERHPGTFLKRVFTENEIIEDSSRTDFAQYYAGRWAAKESLSKSMGCGIGENCYWTDIDVKNDSSGKPTIYLSGKAKRYAASLGVKKIHVSISHEKSYACSTVILEG